MTMKQYRLTSSKVTHYIAFIEAESDIDAYNIATKNDNIEWKLLDEDDMDIYEIDAVD